MPSQPATPKNLARERHIFCGQVQGVGFRPFIYGMAIEQELTGFVKNTADGVVVEVQGEPENLACFASVDYQDRSPQRHAHCNSEPLLLSPACSLLHTFKKPKALLFMHAMNNSIC